MTGPAYDVAVIGAGVIGAAIAAELSQRSLRVLWLEAAHDVAEGASKANSAIACTGYDLPVGTLESELVRAASPQWEAICRALDVPFKRVGVLALAFDEAEQPRLEALAAQAHAAGVESEVLAGAPLERALAGAAPGAIRALHVPGEGIIDPIRLTIGWAELAVRNGADLRLGTPAHGFRHAGDGTITAVETHAGVFRVRAVVNAAGLHVDAIARAAAAEPVSVWPRKGQFLLLDRAVGAGVPKILACLPTETTRGVLAVPTTNGSVLLGPTAQDGTDREDGATDEPTLDTVLARARRLLPAARRSHVIKTFAGLRPASEHPYRVERSARVPNLIHAAGIRSTGVSSSPAVADRVRALLEEAGLHAPLRTGATTSIPRVPRLAEVSTDTAAEAAASLPGYGTIVCACEHVSAGEIRAACRTGVPARSLDGIRKRTRAMAGRCQGAYCSAGAGFILSVEAGLEPWAVPQGAPATAWGEPGA